MSSAVKRENVWDYPRPPAIERTDRRLKVVYHDKGTDVILADTSRAFRILETSHPPTYYIPPSDVRMKFLEKSTLATFCEWKGTASYYNFVPPSKTDIVRDRIWFYANADGSGGKHKELKDHVSFYVGPWKCFVDEEEVKAQPGYFYGGWRTWDIEGEAKGGPGTLRW